MRIPFLAAVAGAVLLVAAAPAHAAPTYPTATYQEARDNQQRWAATGADVTPSPPGVNREDCTPGQRTVVLLHGWQSDRYVAWAHLGPTLANAGYCVRSFTYGGSGRQGGGQAPLVDSAKEIASLVTGFDDFAVIGHSEGGVLAQFLAQSDPGFASRVRSVITIESPTRGLIGPIGAAVLDGTNARGLISANCVACADLLAGSPFMTALNSRPIAAPGVSFTTVSSRTDPLAPPAVAGIDGARNLVLQDFCPASVAGHSGSTYSPTTATLVLNALDGQARPVPCQPDVPN